VCGSNLFYTITILISKRKLEQWPIGCALATHRDPNRYEMKGLVIDMREQYQVLRPTESEEPSSGGKRRTGVLRPTEGLLYRKPKVEESNYKYIYIVGRLPAQGALYRGPKWRKPDGNRG
jgi:hypothetical protein